MKRSDIITGRGFAAPPKLTIDTHPSPDPGHFYTDNELQYNSYQQQPGTKHQPPYSYRLELETNVREDFTITEKAPTWYLVLVKSSYNCFHI